MGVGTVRYTLAVFTLLKVTTGLEACTLRPDATLAALVPLDAGLAAFGQTGTALPWGALHALVVHACELVAVGTVFVAKTIDAATRTVAFLPFRAVLFGTTNALVVLGAFLGGAGVGLAVCVLQAGYTLPFG